MNTKVYQIQIALKGFKPKIWRRILVDSNLLLKDFHMIIQITMGWSNSHLHQFIKNKVYYTVRFPDDDAWGELASIDYEKKKIKISDLLPFEKDKITYEYDFGDGWEHDVISEKILPYNSNIKNSVCIAGKMHCPPEDCGGVGGYSYILEILKDSNHEEYDSYRSWLEEDFNQYYFDIDEVNMYLSQ